jgi:hypothetical protein
LADHVRLGCKQAIRVGRYIRVRRLPSGRALAEGPPAGCRVTDSTAREFKPIRPTGSPMHFVKLNRPTGVRNSLVEQFVDLAARRLAILLANRSPSTVKLMHTFGKLKPVGGDHRRPGRRRTDRASISSLRLRSARTSANPKALHP